MEYLVAQPNPGDIYKEYYLVPQSDNWRVTDPKASYDGAQEFLPNPDLRFQVDDLDGAIKAELVIDRWGGHAGTYGQRFQLNASRNEWIPVPDREVTMETMDVHCYLYQDNPVVEVPLEYIEEGENTLRGTSEGQSCFDFGWGQWGWYGIILRVYYDKSKPHPTGEITFPKTGATIVENPPVRVSAQSPNSTVKSVRVIGYYEGMDVDGDGVFKEWHRRYNYVELDNIVGTDTMAPYVVEWNTRHVPDQEPGEIKFMARIEDENGYWSVTEVVDQITLKRVLSAVAMYTPHSVPAKFNVRIGDTKSASIHIDSSYSLSMATEAAVHLRTWNGFGELFWFNTEYGLYILGESHKFDYKARKIQPEWLKYASNSITISSLTEHHGPEILWPGPVITVRYKLYEDASCDLNGDGRANILDIIHYLLLLRNSAEDPLLDWNGDENNTLTDIIELAEDIRKGTCVEVRSD